MKSKLNKTLELLEEDYLLKDKLITLQSEANKNTILNKTLLGDTLEQLKWIPNETFDLIFADPPYNLDKSFSAVSFKEMPIENYNNYLMTWLPELINKLKPNGSIYICSDWKSSTSIHTCLDKCGLKIRNRITFERDKGRGSKTNYKMNSEDIWFATKSNDYYFNYESIKLKRKVYAPYKDDKLENKDWEDTPDGKSRLTHASNIWTDLVIPFWSMSENTEHPTQKPEKLLAKIIMASSKENDFIFDPFLGSGTTSVVAKKLNRNYCGIELNLNYALIVEKRLLKAETNTKIQGYDGIHFLDKNFEKNN